MRGTFVSFGNASGKLEPLDVGKLIAPKGLYLTKTEASLTIHLLGVN